MTEYEKKIKIKVDINEAKKKINDLENALKSLSKSDPDYKPTVQQLINANKELDKLNKKLETIDNKNKRNEESKNRQLKFDKQLLENANRRAKIEEQLNKQRQSQNLKQFSKGVDIFGSVGKFAKNPFAGVIDLMTAAPNKAFEQKAELNEKEFAANVAEISDIDKQIAAFEEKGDLTKEEQKEQAKLTARKSDLEKRNKELSASSAKVRVAQGVMNTFAKTMKTALKPLNDLKHAVVENVKAMLSLKSGIATFSTSTSLITNASAREQQLKYGLSSAQNYGFTQAKSMLNIQSDEDLMYMNAQQREKLLGYMEKYSNWYSEMEQSGVLQNIQEMQLQFQELKQELAMEFLQWVAQNKETIMACIRGIFNFIKVIANIVMGIIKIISFGTYSGEEAAVSSDSYNSNSMTNNSTKNNNININANVTNNGSQESIQQSNDTMWSDLAKKIVTATE